MGIFMKDVIVMVVILLMFVAVPGLWLNFLKLVERLFKFVFKRIQKK